MVSLCCFFFQPFLFIIFITNHKYKYSQHIHILNTCFLVLLCINTMEKFTVFSQVQRNLCRKSVLDGESVIVLTIASLFLVVKSVCKQWCRKCLKIFRSSYSITICIHISSLVVLKIGLMSQLMYLRPHLLIYYV